MADTTSQQSSERDTALVARARAFAHQAHGAIEQTRKYTGEPYTVHLAAVAALVESAGGTAEMVAAAWLHDVVEDTPTTLRTVAAEFGSAVGALVEQLTDVSKPEDGNRAVRKALDRDHLAEASPEAQTVKLADLIDNSDSITEHDPGFARVYMQEKRELLKVLTAGDRDLWARANAIVEGYEAGRDADANRRRC
ncbi:MAG: HD domain-containing protein [Pseudomonadota bacterium]